MESMTITETLASAGMKCFGVTKQTERTRLLLPPLALSSLSGPLLANPNKEPLCKGEMGVLSPSPAPKADTEGRV